MRLSPARFDAMLRQMGQNVLWRPASLCPCRDPYSGAALAGCPQCSAHGVLWAAPVAAWTGVAGLKIARQFADFSRWEGGDVVLTVPGASPLWAAGENDQVIMSQASEPFQAVLTNDGAPKISVAQGPVVSIARCFWLLPPNSTIVTGGIPTVAADGSLTWPNADGPPAGFQFSLQGRKSPIYYVFGDLPQDRSHFGGLALPRRIQARRFDLFGR